VINIRNPLKIMSPKLIGEFRLKDSDKVLLYILLKHFSDGSLMIKLPSLDGGVHLHVGIKEEFRPSVKIEACRKTGRTANHIRLDREMSVEKSMGRIRKIFSKKTIVADGVADLGIDYAFVPKDETLHQLMRPIHYSSGEIDAGGEENLKDDPFEDERYFSKVSLLDDGCRPHAHLFRMLPNGDYRVISPLGKGRFRYLDLSWIIEDLGQEMKALGFIEMLRQIDPELTDEHTIT